MQQRRIDDVGMADHPADVRRGPEHLAGPDAELVPHRPFERDHVAAIVAHHALRLSRRAGRVEHVERIGCRDRHAFHLGTGGLGGLYRIAVVDVAAVGQVTTLLLALQDDARPNLVPRHGDRTVEQRLVGDHAARLDAAGCGNDQVGLCVVDTGGEFLGREPAEHHGVDGAEPRAGEHGECRFRDHRHVDDDAIALADALAAYDRGERLDLLLELRVGEALLGARDRAVVNQRRLVGTAALDMPVDAVVAGIAGRACEPSAVDVLIWIENRLPRRKPVDLAGRPCPERLRVPLPALIDLVVARIHP